jgi:hypothetical protein
VVLGVDVDTLLAVRAALRHLHRRDVVGRKVELTLAAVVLLPVRGEDGKATGDPGGDLVKVHDEAVG